MGRDQGRLIDPVPAEQHIDTNGPPCRCFVGFMVLLHATLP